MSTRRTGRLLGLILLAVGGGTARGQTPPPDPAVVQAGCATCGPAAPGPRLTPGLFGAGKHWYEASAGCGAAGCADAGCGGCGEAGCVAGRDQCAPCHADTCFGRVFCGFYNALCCPDPCYEPRWTSIANAAFFADSARPTTMTRLRWDSGFNLIFPDRSEFFWAAIGRKGPRLPETGLDYDELSIYNEIGGDKFSFFIDTPYRNLDSEVNRGSGGFGDLRIGTKSVLLDSELLLTSFQFQTFIPTGSPRNGTGVGHVALEPSILSTMKLLPETYLQSQVAYRIPVSATEKFAGSVLHYHFSVNHVLARPIADAALIGTLEFGGYTFTAGRYTDPRSGLELSANERTYLQVGPGLRMAFCDKLDFGVGTQFSLTSQHFARELFRTELRWRF